MRTEPGRILVVASDPIARATIASQLAEDGHDVVEATDAQGAVDQLRPGDIDAVVVDLDGPPDEGSATFASPDQEEAMGAVPVVVVAPRDGAEEEPTARDTPAFDVVRKPVGAIDLRARVAVALRLARAEQDLAECRRLLQQATRTDPLTGLANRTHVDEHLAMTMSAARRHRQEVALLLVDIDHLRRINDAEGHAAGDDVLRGVATRVLRALRSEDFAGRWGGEELLVIAGNTDLDGAWRLGERIREAVSGSPIPVSTGRDVLVTVSVGCATGAGDDIDGHLRRVEAAVELAKSQGRNRVCTDAAAN